MVHLTTFLTTAILASTGLSAPAPADSDAVTSIYGPLDTWTPVKLIDVYPDALVDGLPVNDSVIYSYEPPASATLAQHDALSAALSARSLFKRESQTCYRSGTYVFQSQLQSAKNTICSEASGKSIDNGGSYGSFRSWYDAGGNNWRHIQNSNGNDATVWFWIKIHEGNVFNWNLCFNGFYKLIQNCHGSNPDSAGGVIWGYSEKIDVQIDPQ
ncbi:hypothetical protein DL95DRAFT_498670 [Leptodontidium sp. 2 PMI_412]|nr:hypothetical protein DL95DRAFT_498670 [Leptodontidium sp. 2 PMI_412]